MEKYHRNINDFPVFHDDGYLNDFKDHFAFRNDKFLKLLEQIVKVEKGLV